MSDGKSINLTVGMLRTILSPVPDDIEVMVSGYEDGICEPGFVGLVPIKRNTFPASSWWSGPHSTDNRRSREVQELVMLISRYGEEIDDE